MRLCCESEILVNRSSTHHPYYRLIIICSLCANENNLETRSSGLCGPVPITLYYGLDLHHILERTFLRELLLHDSRTYRISDVSRVTKKPAFLLICVREAGTVPVQHERRPLTLCRTRCSMSLCNIDDPVVLIPD